MECNDLYRLTQSKRSAAHVEPLRCTTGQISTRDVKSAGYSPLVLQTMHPLALVRAADFRQARTVVGTENC